MNPYRNSAAKTIWNFYSNSSIVLFMHVGSAWKRADTNYINFDYENWGKRSLRNVGFRKMPTPQDKTNVNKWLNNHTFKYLHWRQSIFWRHQSQSYTNCSHFKDHYRIHKGPSLDPIFSQMDSVDIKIYTLCLEEPMQFPLPLMPTSLPFTFPVSTLHALLHISMRVCQSEWTDFEQP